MGIYQYFALSLVITSGIGIGAFIASNAKEELSDGAKYIKTLMMTLTYIVLLLTIQKISSNILIIAFIPTAFILLIFYIPRIFRSYIVLFILGVCFSLITKNSIGYVIPSLIFVSMLCVGSMTYHIEKKELTKNILIKSMIFIVTTIIIYFF